MTRIALCFLSVCIVAWPMQVYNQKSMLLPTESGLLANPRLVRTWAERVRAEDTKVRTKAAAKLVRGGAESLPLLLHFLLSKNEGLRHEAFKIIRNIGVSTFPLLTELLK
jgi:hypothetical protein